MRKDKAIILQEILQNPIYRVDLQKGLIYGQDEKPLGSPNAHGYLCTTFRFKGKRYTFPIHQIIAFVGGLDILPPMTINHIDGNKQNNSILNLEAISSADNVRHAFQMGLVPNDRALQGEESSSAKLTEDTVREIRQRRCMGAGVRQMSREYGVAHTTILDILERRTWKHIS